MCVWEVEVVINGRGENGKGRGNTGTNRRLSTLTKVASTATW